MWVAFQATLAKKRQKKKLSLPMFHQAYIRNNLKMCNNLSNPIEKNIVNLLVIHTS